MKHQVGWLFPPTGGGQEDGFQHPGIAHFSGSRLRSLARKTTQNSLDARAAQEAPVEMCFEIIDLPSHTELGWSELAEVLEKCEAEARTRRDSTAVAFLADARKLLDKSTVRSLRIYDKNTTGLAGDRWRTLVKTQGLSLKDGKGAMGSRGTGKFAPFSISQIRTVFYWTSYAADQGTSEQFQGKAVLLAHDGNGEARLQGTGFFGIRDQCSELTRPEQIPNLLRVLDQDGNPIHGTSLAIAGFAERDGWQRRVAASILENFFHSIRSAHLRVVLEPSNGEDEISIDETTLDLWFEHLLQDGGLGNEQMKALREAHTFRSLFDDERTVKRETQDRDLGHCELWILVADKEQLPRKVALVRSSGMLVTTRQTGLILFSGFRDFAAVAVFTDPDGNELLRDMENPNHDQFEPDRVQSEREKRRAKAALKRITTWIRTEIKSVAGPRDDSHTKIVDELARYLPDLHPDDAFGEGEGSPSNAEKRFEDGIEVLEREVRRAKRPFLDDESDSEHEGDGEDTGHEGGGGAEGRGEGRGGGSGDGEGEGGTGGRGGTERGSALSIQDVRLLPVSSDGRRLELSFVPETGGSVELKVLEAGDSTAIPHPNLQVLAKDGWQSADGHLCELEAHRRKTIHVRSSERIDDRSWSVVARPARLE